MSSIPVGLCQCGCGAKTNLAQKTSARYGWVKGQPLRYRVGHGDGTRHITVSRERLVELYVTERRSARNIADLLGVSAPTVKRWLRKADIERRRTGSPTTLAARGIEAPTREELERMIHVEHLSYRAIAKRYGVDHTAVPYWLKAHGIETPTVWATRRKGVVPELPEPDRLRALLADGVSLAEVARRYGVSATTLKPICEAHRIPVARPGWQGGKRFDAADGHEVRSTYELHVCEWLHERGIAHDYEPRLPFDRRCKADFLANGWYVEVWGVTNSPRYRARRDRKREGYAAHGLPLVEISHYHFSTRRRHILMRRLEQILTPPS